MRRCSKCDEVKSDYINKCSYCKDCYNKHYRDKNRENFKHKVIKSSIYVITNPAWPEYVKLGRSKNVDNRLRTYQTHSPFKDYRVEFKTAVEDVYLFEKALKRKLGTENGEWYKITVEDALKIINNIKDEYKKG